MNDITKLICAYTRGDKTLEETNAALQVAGSGLYLDPEKNVIRPDEVGRFGLLDTGTGVLDKVEIADGHLVSCDCGDMKALCMTDGRVYRVKGTELILHA